MRRNLTPAAAVPLALLLLLAAAAPPLGAAGVRDDAGFFSRQTRDTVNSTLQRIQQQRGKNVVVETYPGIPQSMQGSYDPNNKTNFFDQWMVQRGREAGADLFILITREPAHVQVGESAATRNSGAFTVENRRQATTTLLDAFKAKQFDQGLVQTVNYIDRTLGQNTGPERSANASPSRSS